MFFVVVADFCGGRAFLGENREQAAGRLLVVVPVVGA
jgi:hypothetical protein